MSRFIVGDIHGSYDRLMTALDLCKFSDSDILYCTGDIGDRGPDVRKCIDFLMSLGNRFKSVIGNHDIWAYQYLSDTISRTSSDIWEYNGGLSTEAALFNMDNKEEVAAWYGSFPYIIEESDFRLVHTLTYTRKLDKSKVPLSEITMKNIDNSGIMDNSFGYDSELFDRHILYRSKYFNKELYKSGYFNKEFSYLELAKEECSLLDNKLTIIGHTPLTGGILYDKKMNVCDIDTGGFCTYKKNKYEGKITVLNIDTKDFVDSSGFTSNLEAVKIEY